MKKIEIKITSFQAENYRLQLLYITKEMKNGTIKKIYEVRENRKIICSNVLPVYAMDVYIRCIHEKMGDIFNQHYREEDYAIDLKDIDEIDEIFLENNKVRKPQSIHTP